jgi:hypothetical protein
MATWHMGTWGHGQIKNPLLLGEKDVTQSLGETKDVTQSPLWVDQAKDVTQSRHG